MKFYFILSIALSSLASLQAQVPYSAAAPNGYTKKASVAEQVGLTEVKVTYNRPAVKGREGKIWGQLIHIGFADPGFGKRNPVPWRAGANENTTIEFDTDVTVEGQPLSKGKYGLFIAYDPTESQVIFSRRSDAWGSFFYDEKEDALRVSVKPKSLDKSVEHLTYEFIDQTPNAAVVALSWERLSIPFKVEVDYRKQLFDAFFAEAQNPRGFTSQGLNIAATWALHNNYELEQALAWSIKATGNTFPGDPTSFAALSTKAAILDKLGKADESGEVIKSMLAFGSINQLYQFGKRLIAEKKPKVALDVFEFNYNKHPDQFITLAGMVRGLSANAAYSKALEFADRALAAAPDAASREGMSAMIKQLKLGKDIN